MTAFLFWLTAAIMVYVYLGYPLLARQLAKIFGKPVDKRPVAPTLTVVVAAYNEERGIAAKLDNLLSLDYPLDKLRIVVASDGSTDGTDAIVREHGSPCVQLLRVEGRVGKTECQNRAVQASDTEIVVFTDATTRIDSGALAALARNFADAHVGCAAAQLVYEAKDQGLTATGGTAYWGYEVALRQAESALGSLVGVSGCLYAVRRSAYRPINPALISDFVIAMRMQEQGLRTVFEPAALCYEDTLDRTTEELSMRVRVAIRSIAALVIERRFLNPLRHGLFALQLLSHKALRYASPFIWLITLSTAGLLAARPFYRFCLVAQLAVIAAGATGFALHARGKSVGLLGKPYYFLLTNLASLLAVLRYARGERVRIWNPVRS